MKYQVLFAVPLLAAAAYLAGTYTLDASMLPAFDRAEVEVVKGLSVVGCVLAALAFERGDYLRRAWALYGLCSFLLMVRDFVFIIGGTGPAPLGIASGHWELALVTVANASNVWGTWILSRAWQVAGLDLPGSQWRRRAVIAVAVIVSLAITGAQLVIDLRGSLHGSELSAVARIGLVSDIGDILALLLISPVLLTAFAMRGGVLKWPWGFITLSMLCWLVYDSAGTLAYVADLDRAAIHVVSEVFRGLACCFTFSAGVAQRLAVKGD